MRVLLNVLLIVILLQGCTLEVREAAAPVDAEQEARKLLNDGRYQQAAGEYLRLAELFPEKSGFYTLQAASAMISMQRTAEAAELLSTVAPQDADGRILKTLLQAELHLQEQQPEQALELLSADFPDVIPAALQARRHEARALAYEQRADFINAAAERISYGAYARQRGDTDAHTAKIWETLNKADKQMLRELHSADPQALSGWLELALINRTMLADLTALTGALAAWQGKYPAHPASPGIVAQMRAAGRRYDIRPRRIALLLPLRGGYRKAAEAIRDGFMTAWYDSGRDRPLIRIYEGNSLNIEQVYSQAVAEGADFIVGPLEKQALTRLSARADLSVPTLALNRVRPAADMASRGNGNLIPALMQFGLSPEDEARQVADRAFADGHSRALVIVPDDQWGGRLYDAFRENWLALGGNILERIDYDPQSNDYSAPVTQLLNVDGSESRVRNLRQALNRRLENLTRRRQDADVIFMAAFPIAGRQIIPQLRFHEAGGIPVYATSHVFTGSVNPQADMDMDGVMFPDLPWILFPHDGSASIKARVNENFQADTSVYQRLYALGVDVFHLIPHLYRLAFDDDARFSGETGLLSMSGDGRIRRNLPWGKIINGKPELLEHDG